MGSVRAADGRRRRVFDQESRRQVGARARIAARSLRSSESVVLDIVYVLGVLALFALVGLIGRAVEKL
ncbi:hypothetical protein [Microbacterium sp. No. 7]|uniref:hypothetical protein n=1 Tax=Microbacterium sp. No. 7 TaxID=1714373 RepID=UPI000A81E3DF|nr:hypothetical protein [Microbacterium sp. No. 7]